MQGIKIKIKFPKYSIGEKIIHTTKRIAQKAILKGDNDIVQEYTKRILKVRM